MNRIILEIRNIQKYIAHLLEDKKKVVPSRKDPALLLLYLGF